MRLNEYPLLLMTSWIHALWRYLRGYSAERGHGLKIIMYTRRGCHLCEVAWQLLRAEQERFRFQLESVDVDQQPDLAARYGEEVPVVSVNGKVRFRGIVNAALLRRLLDAEMSMLQKSSS